MDNGKVVIKKERRFKYAWLDEDNFKGWLAPHPTDRNKAMCISCNIVIRCCKTDLTRHAQTPKHINKLTNKNQSLNESTISHIDEVKSTEIQLAAFFVEHNVAFYTADHLIPLLKKVCIKPEVVQDLSLARSKCSNIVKEVIAKRETEKLVENLQSRRFSILIDESTDITDTKIMCVLVQFLSTNKKLKTQLLELIPLDATDCSASKLFKIFKEALEKKNIPLKNIVGMASDNASVMIGRKNSFFSHLQLEVPDVVLLNCICHSSAIVASKACEELPKSCENLIRGIATYVSGSAKRCAILKEFQDFFEVEKNKILKLSNTRWLVLHKCVTRILDNWDVLTNFFILAVHEDKLKSAETILSELNNITIKSYLLFLKFSLHFFNSFNAFFQSRKILVHKLFENSQQMIRQIAQNFMTLEALKDIVNLDVENENNILSLDNIYVGSECENLLATLPLEEAQEIRVKCLKFYKTAVREMLKRLPYKGAFFQHLTFLNPDIALFDEARIKIKDLSCIAARIAKNINFSTLNYEWRILPSVFNNLKKKELACLEINEMWKKILEFKDCSEEQMFPNLEIIVEAVFSLPHSNAEAERIFSIVTDVKNKKRNRLSVETISAICIARSSFQAEGTNCINFEVDSRHLELHSPQNLYVEQCSSSNND
ncbi:hypothetical protein ALC62_15647 [Cyphomyrmex costatus]|uniref:HAT C-terminal dimerisation domain-containing protein n=1 Tax=Cyphomyrmex costatus TaxID=456900 RepID=A0A151I6M1_9HYME|nr:hypothetical protein ALC62_15647 [Cyphomyrmex costatus]